MGCYMEDFATATFDKAEILIRDFGAEVVDPPAYVHPSTGELLVCVVQNATYEAVGVAYSEAEFTRFISGLGARTAWWVRLDIVTIRRYAKGLDDCLRLARRKGRAH